MKKLLLVLFTPFLVMSCSKSHNPKTSIKKLEQGNQRFAYDDTADLRRDSARRLELSDAQEPFAAVVACSDSRVVSELIFDQGLGDLFIVRTAGNVIGPLERESLLFAVEVLKVPLIMVLGHQNCGAVKGVLEHDEAVELIPDIRQLIEPATRAAKGEGEERLRNAIDINACNMAEILRSDPQFASRVEAGKLVIRAGYYDFDTGKVTFFDKKE